MIHTDFLGTLSINLTRGSIDHCYIEYLSLQGISLEKFYMLGIFKRKGAGLATTAVLTRRSFIKL